MYNIEIETKQSQRNAFKQSNEFQVQGTLDWLKTQARFGVPVWAVCQNCDHTRLLDAGDLLAMLKPSKTAMMDLTRRMCCQACNGRACELRAATPVPEYFA